MNKEISHIIQQFFHKDSLAQVDAEELSGFIKEHPYVASARFLMAKKIKEEGDGAAGDEAITGSLFFHNPLWFQHQLNAYDGEPEVELPPQTQEEPEQHQPIEPEKEEPPAPVENENQSPIIFQSYHTIDYFASQGIRLQQADLGKDKLGQQLKSFTEWLRSMKKLPTPEGEVDHSPEDDNRQQLVITTAAHSIEEKEVVTETMAEVWAKQGNTQKAIDTYHKLSLLNPGKSAYFAAKIDQLK